MIGVVRQLRPCVTAYAHYPLKWLWSNLYQPLWILVHSFLQFLRAHALENLCLWYVNTVTSCNETSAIIWIWGSVERELKLVS